MSDVIRKNKATDKLDKIELDMDQGSMKAFTLIYDKNMNIEHNFRETKSGAKVRLPIEMNI